MRLAISQIQILTGLFKLTKRLLDVVFDVRGQSCVINQQNFFDENWTNMIFAFRWSKLNNVSLIIVYKYTALSDCLNAKLNNREMVSHKVSTFSYACLNCEGLWSCIITADYTLHVHVEGGYDVQQLWSRPVFISNWNMTTFPAQSMRDWWKRYIMTSHFRDISPGAEVEKIMSTVFLVPLYPHWNSAYMGLVRT